MSTLSEFLLARIDEDERNYGVIVAEMAPADPPVPFIDLAVRVLTECDAKRRIVESEDAPYPTGHAPNTRTKRLLALPYADHPDYRDEWRP